MSAVLFTLAHHPPARHRERALRRRGVRDRRRAARQPSSISQPEETGCARRVVAHPRERATAGRYIATTQIGMSRGEPWPRHVRRACRRRVDGNVVRSVQPCRVDCRAHGGERRRHRGADVPPHRPRRDGAEDARAAACDAHSPLRVAESSRRIQKPVLPLVVALNGIGNAAAAGWSACDGGVSKQSGITSTEELQLIIQESQEAACCAASRGGSCASCSSLATSPPAGDGAARAARRDSRRHRRPTN